MLLTPGGVIAGTLPAFDDTRRHRPGDHIEHHRDIGNLRQYQAGGCGAEHIDQIRLQGPDAGNETMQPFRVLGRIKKFKGDGEAGTGKIGLESLFLPGFHGARSPWRWSDVNPGAVPRVRMAVKTASRSSNSNTPTHYNGIAPKGCIHSYAF